MWSFGLMILVKIKLVSKTKTVFLVQSIFCLVFVCCAGSRCKDLQPTFEFGGWEFWSDRWGARVPHAHHLDFVCLPAKRDNISLYSSFKMKIRYCRFEVSAYEWAALRAKLLLAGWALTCSRLDQFHRTCGKVRRRNKRGVNLRQL